MKQKFYRNLKSQYYNKGNQNLKDFFDFLEKNRFIRKYLSSNQVKILIHYQLYTISDCEDLITLYRHEIPQFVLAGIFKAQYYFRQRFDVNLIKTLLNSSPTFELDLVNLGMAAKKLKGFFPSSFSASSILKLNEGLVSSKLSYAFLSCKKHPVCVASLDEYFKKENTSSESIGDFMKKYVIYLDVCAEKKVPLKEILSTEQFIRLYEYGLL